MNWFTPPTRKPKQPRPILRMPSNAKASRVAILVFGAACINAVIASAIVFVLLLLIGVIVDIPWNIRWIIVAVSAVLGAGSGLLVSRLILHEAAVQEEGK